MYLMTLGVLCFLSFVGTEILSGGIHQAHETCEDIYNFFDPLKELYTLLDKEQEQDNTITYEEFEAVCLRLGGSVNLTVDELAVNLEESRPGLGILAPYFLTSIDGFYKLQIIYHLNYDKNLDDRITYSEFKEDYERWKKYILSK